MLSLCSLDGLLLIKFFDGVIISENSSVDLRNLITLSVSLNKSKTELIFCGVLSFVILYFHIHSIRWANLLLMNGNEQDDMTCRNLLCQRKMVMRLLVVLDLYSLETVACLFVELWQWTMSRMNRAISFHVVLGLSYGFYLWKSIALWTNIWILWHCLWLEVLLYLLSVAWNLQRRWKRIFSLVLSERWNALYVQKMRCYCNILYSSISPWVSSGSWFAIKSFTY